jgi:hypothetical protein
MFLNPAEMIVALTVINPFTSLAHRRAATFS